jgi:hypothetical protein
MLILFRGDNTVAGRGRTYASALYPGFLKRKNKTSGRRRK